MEVIGVDLGNGLVKTVNTEFISSIREYGENKPAIKDRTVFFEGKYYTVGGKRTLTKTDLKEDETALILTLAGIGEELKVRGIDNGEIVLSEGLPLARCIEENKISDAEYYRKGQTIYFEYEDVPHEIKIVDVLVNPQCVSAIIDLLDKGILPDPCICIDVGSWTIDLITIEDNSPQGATSQSWIRAGVIKCIQDCNSKISDKTGKEVLETQIQKVMLGDKTALPPMHVAIIDDITKKYVKYIADNLNEHGYNTDTLTCIFLGGGASIVKNYGMERFPLSKYITNIRANAIGYEKIGRAIYGM